jgi:hypothetical protein
VFLLPMAVFIAFGAYELIRRWSATSLLLLGGFIAAPLPIAIALPEAPGSSTGRALVMLVFGVLVGAAGVQAMWRLPGLAVRPVVVVLLALAPIQFMAFRSDYFANYLERSWMRFDPNATRSVVEAVITINDREEAPAILLNDDGDNKSIRWRYYTHKHRRADLWARTRYFQVDDAATVAALPPRSLVLMRANDPRSAALVAAGCSKVATITAVGGEPATDIFRR